MPSVLIVEDDRFVREFLARAFKADGWLTAAASDPNEALTMAAGTRFDLLLVDVVLPVMDGPTLVRRLSRDLPDARALLMSGYPASHLEQKHCHLTGAPFLQKPFAVRTALTRARAMIGNHPSAA